MTREFRNLVDHLSKGGRLEKQRKKTAMKRSRADHEQLIQEKFPSSYMPNVPRQVRADGGKVDHRSHLMHLINGFNSGGEVKDPSKRAMFGMFMPQEQNLPATTEQPSLPQAEERPSASPITQNVAEKIAQMPMTRRGFMETARGAMAAARFAPQLSKLSEMLPKAEPVKEVLPKAASQKAIWHVKDYLEEMFNHFEESGYDHTVPYEMMQSALHSYAKESGMKPTIKNVKQMIEDLHDPELFLKHYFSNNQLTEGEIEALSDNENLQQLLDYHYESTLPEYGKYEWDELKDVVKDAQKERTGKAFGGSMGDDQQPPLGHNNPPYERDLNAFGLYSKAAEVASQATGQNEMQTPDQWEKYLLARGVKPDEIRWSWLHDAFDDKDRKYHKDEIASQFNYANQVPYEERVYKSDGKYSSSEAGMQNLAMELMADRELANRVLGEDRANQVRANLNEDPDRTMTSLTRGVFAPYLEDYIDNQQGSNSPPKYEEYQMEGDAKNYRELVLQHQPDVYKYASSHYNDQNPLLHIRMSDRTVGLTPDKIQEIESKISQATDAPVKSWGAGMADFAAKDGLITPEEAATYARHRGWQGSQYFDQKGLEQKLLHIEEMQSDWGQQGRKAGFNEEDKKKQKEELQKAEKEFHEFDFRTRNKYRKELESQGLSQREIRIHADDPSLNQIVNEINDVDLMDEYKAIYDRHKKALSRHRLPIVNEGPHIGDTNKWVDLGLKRILKEAADGGYDGITFAPGDNQVARWNDKGLKKPYDETIPSRMQKLLTKIDPQLKFGSYAFDLPIWKDEQYGTVATNSVHYVPLNEMHHTEIKKGFERMKRGGAVRQNFAIGGNPGDIAGGGYGTGNIGGGSSPSYSANGGQDSPSESSGGPGGTSNWSGGGGGGSSFSTSGGGRDSNISVSSNGTLNTAGNGRDSAPSIGGGTGIPGFGSAVGRGAAESPAPSDTELGNEGPSPTGPFGFGAGFDVGQALVANVLGGGNAQATAPGGISNYAAAPSDPGYSSTNVTAMRAAGSTESNLNKLNSLAPAFQPKAATLINRAMDLGMNPTITSAARTLADQARINTDPNQIYPSAAPGQSLHNYGLAIDLGNMTPQQQRQLSQIAGQEGMEWGGASDPVHYGIATPGMTNQQTAASLGASLYTGAKNIAQELLGIKPAAAETNYPPMTRGIGAPPPADFNVPNAGDLYGATNAPLAVEGPLTTPLSEQLAKSEAGMIARQGDVPGMSSEALEWNKAYTDAINKMYGNPNEAGLNKLSDAAIKAALDAPETAAQLEQLGAAINLPFGIGSYIGSQYGVQPATPQQQADVLRVMNFANVPQSVPADFATEAGLESRYGLPPEENTQRAGSVGSMPSSYTVYDSNLNPVNSSGPQSGSMGSVSANSFKNESGNIPLPPERPSEFTSMLPSSGRQNYEPSTPQRTGSDSSSRQQTVRSSFDSAFAAARKAGQATFQWRNPLTGEVGTYTTELKASGGSVKSSVSKNGKLLHTSPAVEIALSRVSSLPLDAVQMIKNGTRGRS